MEILTGSLVAVLIGSVGYNLYLLAKKRQKENNELVLQRIIHDCISIRTKGYDLEKRSRQIFQSLASIADEEVNSFAIIFIQNELAQLFISQLITSGIITAVRAAEENKRTYNQVLARILMKPGIAFIKNPLGLSDEKYVMFVVELFFAKYRNYESDVQFLFSIKQYVSGEEVFSQKLIHMNETDIDEQILLSLFRSTLVKPETKHQLSVKYYQHVVDKQEAVRITSNTKELLTLDMLRKFIDTHAVVAA